MHRRGEIIALGRRPEVLVALVLGAMAALYGWLEFLTTFFRPGMIGIDYIAPGTDFMVFHEVARNALGGSLAAVLDGDTLTKNINADYSSWLGHALSYRAWIYPPSFLLVLLPFGCLPFLPAYALFEIASAVALYFAVTVDAKPGDHARTVAWCAFLCPAAAVNAVSGQNGFLVAAALVGGMRLVFSRPLLAGALLGLATIKPHFAILVPIALIAAQQWRGLGAFIVSSAVLALVSLFAFGTGPWSAWLHEATAALASPDLKWVPYGRVWGDSVWACMVTLGLPFAVASFLQWAAVIFAAGCTAVAYHRRPENALPVFLVAALLAAPHWSPYDAVLLTIAGVIAAVAYTGPRIWYGLLALALWYVPLASPPIMIPTGRFIPLLLIVFLVMAIPKAGGSNRLSPSR